MWSGFVSILALGIVGRVNCGGSFWPGLDGGNDVMPSPQFDADLTDAGAELYKGGSLRDLEHLPHSSLWGHKYIGGGAGEGKQYLSPSGALPNKEEIKTDAVLPAYCDPPNPCPPGFFGDDGCLEEFDTFLKNTAYFPCCRALIDQFWN